MINKKPAKKLKNILYYQANRDNDLTNYIESSTIEWIGMATNRHYPMIVKFHISKNDCGSITFDFPVFPANVERTNESMINFLDGKKFNEIPREKLNESKLSYSSDIVNFIKNEIAANYVKALMKNDEKTKDLLSLKMMNGFDYGAFLGGLYSDEMFLPDKELAYQDNYVKAMCFKDQMQQFSGKAEEYYNKHANQSQFGE